MSTAPPDGPRGSEPYGSGPGDEGWYGTPQGYSGGGNYGSPSDPSYSPSGPFGTQHGSQQGQSEYGAAHSGQQPPSPDPQAGAPQYAPAYGQQGYGQQGYGQQGHSAQGSSPQSSSQRRSASWPDALATSAAVVAFLSFWTVLWVAAAAITLGLLGRERAAKAGDRDGQRIAIGAIVAGGLSALWSIINLLIDWARDSGGPFPYGM